ncbi:MAG: NAD-dependent succinate-semialdehyde dehydrogenase [Anaerolineaceae bacterium]|nr:MAG: NAD-dependent succinate-semialdehyde dehydrogenase [Anaerolineaceae bacterium]
MKTYPLYLNGQWISSDETIAVVDPATGEVFAQASTVDRTGVRKALEDAQSALPAWRSLTGMQRGDFLLAIADEVRKRADDIATIMTRENGKPLAQSQGEVNGTIDHLRWFAEEARRAYGRIVPHQAPGKRHLVLKTPVGVVGAIAPWNFPLILSIRKAAPALAAGCTVVLKPASATPLCNLLFAECVEAAGLPPGVFQVVLGSASEIAGEMLENPICRKISFTGSTPVGKRLIEGAAKTCTRLSLELGGNAPVIVFADADMDEAIDGTLMAKFRNTGQSCIAANRIYVERSIYDDFLSAFSAKLQKQPVGPGLEEGVEIGAMIDEPALATALEMIDDTVAQGARLVCGGKRWGEKGSFLAPTILADVPDDAGCMNEEIFAPIAAVSPFDTEEEVIAKANDTVYGLAAYAFTNNLQRTWRLAESLEAGTIGINDGVPSTSNCPFGGFKESGWGRELGIEGMEAFLETKHISLGGMG